MQKTAVHSLLRFMWIPHWSMAVADFILSAKTVLATRTAPSWYSTTTGSRGASIKSATSQSAFHFSILGTGQSASSARTTTTILTGYWFVDKIVCQTKSHTIWMAESTFALKQKMNIWSTMRCQILFLMQAIIHFVLGLLRMPKDQIKHATQYETVES